MKKILSIALGLFAAAVVLVPVKVSAAGMPCTEATLKEFQANKAVAEKELAQVVALKAAADAKVAELKAAGVTGLELQMATDAAFNAANVVAQYQFKVNNAQVSIDAISGRGNVEQYYLDMEAKWKNRSQLDATKVKLDGANQITAAAFEQLNALKTALVNQQGNAASNPALAANVTALQAQVAAAEADYASKKAISDALAAQYVQELATLNFATNEDNLAYAAFVKNYGTNMAKDYKSLDCNGKEYVKFTYYSEDPYIYQKPNEWAIRWFE